MAAHATNERAAIGENPVPAAGARLAGVGARERHTRRALPGGAAGVAGTLRPEHRAGQLHRPEPRQVKVKELVRGPQPEPAGRAAEGRAAEAAAGRRSRP